MLIKWSKTRQDRSQVNSISIPVLGNSPLCPVSALKAMIDIVPATCNDPLFLVPTSRGNVPLTDSMARKHLKKLTTFLKVSGLTFHAGYISFFGINWDLQILGNKISKLYLAGFIMGFPGLMT